MGQGADALRKGHQAFNERDRDALFSVIAEDVTWHGSGAGPFAGTFEGRDDVWEHFFTPVWDAPVRLEDHDVLDNGEHVVGLFDLIFELGGQERSWKGVEVAHFEDGQVTERWAFVERQDELDEFTAQMAAQAGGAT